MRTWCALRLKARHCGLSAGFPSHKLDEKIHKDQICVTLTLKVVIIILQLYENILFSETRREDLDEVRKFHEAAGSQLIIPEGKQKLCGCVCVCVVIT